MSTSLIKCTALFVLISAANVHAQSSEVTLSLDEARERALAALEAGYPQDTALLTRALLLRDPEDVSALLLSAHAAAALAHFEQVLDQAGLAYALSDDDGVRYRAARLLALAHARLGHDTRAQIWLRRARLYAPDDRTIAGLTQDYAYVRRQNPLSLRFDASLTPSSNVNNGSSNDTIRIPGLPFDFSLPPDAQALSGTIATASFSGAYRLSADRDQTTLVRFGLGGSRVWLSQEAKAAAPTANGSDYEQAQATLGLTHTWRGTGGGLPYSLTGTFGYMSYGGAPHTRNGSLALSHGWQIGEDRLQATVFVDQTLYLADDVIANSRGLRAVWGHETAGGNRLSVNAGLRDTMSVSDRRDFSSRSIGVDYSFAEPIAGMDLSLSLQREWKDYADRSLAPDGRSDISDSVVISAGIPEIDLYGFHPVLTLTAAQTTSNVSRYETDRIGFGLSIASSF